tara:strand:+ start:3240 stop:5543 length:2304 start_codon:yes stop_codon:yes gene_type:complete
MPILIDSTEFTNPFGSVESFYQSNAGDEMTAVMTIRGQIRMTSVGNPLTLDPTVNQVQSSGQSWLDNGFRVGQILYCVRYTSGGTPMSIPNNPFWTEVTNVNDTVIDITSCPQWYNIGNSEIMTLTAVVATGSSSALAFDEVDVLFNQQKNGVPASPFSLIDSEVTRARMTGISALSVGASLAGNMLGNQSGGFVKDVSITRVAGVDQFYRYQISVTFVNSGMYDPSWFFTSDCLKTTMSTEWAVVPSEPFNRITGAYSLNGDTGFYDEPFNTGISDAILVQGISEIDYCVPTTATIIVDGPITDIGLGSLYLPDDVTYYRNQVTSQYNLTMVTPTQPVNNFLTTVASELNPSGAGYDIEMTSLTQVGTVSTIEIIITPNPALQTFMDGRDPNDRRFLLWVRCGNLNLLVHDNQLQCSPPVGGPLIMEQSYAFLDHSENVDDAVGDFTGFECNTEDDIGYVGRFLLDKNVEIESFTVRVEAFNSVTDADFTLQEITFGFNTVQISGDGRYLLNETQSVINTLPTTSEKLNAILVLDATLDTPTQYGVKIYAPWLMNWKSWLNQLNASVDFYPTQDQNWVQYDTILPDWTVRMELALLIEGLAYIHNEDITIKDYDSDEFIDQVIELYIDSSNVNVQVVTEGLLMRVVATHTLNNGQNWDQSLTWGMITVEPYQAERRWILSTVVDFDNNTSNPLEPLSGLLMPITYPSPNVARMECFFNPDLIDLTNNIKFTTKIKENCPFEITDFKTMTDGTTKTMTTGIKKTLAL